MTGPLRVLVAVSDHSLGGTSRSAASFALAWNDAGADVTVLAIGGLSESRSSSLRSSGVKVASDVDDVAHGAWNLLHLHHGADSSATRRWTSAVLTAMDRDTVVLTHNVFGQQLRSATPPRTVVGVLGDWVALQHRLQAPRDRRQMRVVPNPQDFDFFRPPSSAERAGARRELGIPGDAHVTLRLGSPIEEKWSSSGYRALVRRREKGMLRLIGAPPSLAGIEEEGVYVSGVPYASDILVRQEYWAADAFAVWSRRGESFGNVLLEALGCGLPVVYKAVVTRDNTPFEFQDIPNFHYVTSARRWLRGAGSVTARSARGAALMRYGRAAITKQLMTIAAVGDGDPDAVFERVLLAFSAPRRATPTQVMLAALRHNPLMAVAKSLRHRLRSRSALGA